MIELLQSDTFWSALGAIATVFATIAIYLAARQLRFDAWIKTQERFMDKDFTDARTRVFAFLDDPKITLTDDDKYLICRRMDELAHLAQFLGKGKVLKYWGVPIANSWFILQSFVEEERKRCKNDSKWEAFKGLGIEALKDHPRN